MQAVVVAAVTATLSLMMMPLSYLSGATIGLVTLRIGYRQGIEVALLATVATGLLGWFAVEVPAIGFAYLVGLWMPVWVMAISLHRSVDMARSLLLAGVFGAILIAGFYLALGDPTQWWQAAIDGFLAEILTEQEMGDVQIVAFREQLASMMTGLMAAGLTLNLLVCLFIARWWQAILVNPGGFGREYRQLRLGRGFSGLSLAVAVVSLLPDAGMLAMIAGDLLKVMVVLLALQGLALAHDMVHRAGAHRGWLVGVYFLLLLASQASVITLALAGLLDNWVNFRSLAGERGGGDNSS